MLFTPFCIILITLHYYYYYYLYYLHHFIFTTTYYTSLHLTIIISYYLYYLYYPLSYHSYHFPYFTIIIYYILLIYIIYYYIHFITLTYIYIYSISNLFLQLFILTIAVVRLSPYCLLHKYVIQHNIIIKTNITNAFSSNITVIFPPKTKNYFSVLILGPLSKSKSPPIKSFGRPLEFRNFGMEKACLSEFPKFGIRTFSLLTRIRTNFRKIFPNFRKKSKIRVSDMLSFRISEKFVRIRIRILTEFPTKKSEFRPNFVLIFPNFPKDLPHSTKSYYPYFSTPASHRPYYTRPSSSYSLYHTPNSLNIHQLL